MGVLYKLHLTLVEILIITFFFGKILRSTGIDLDLAGHKFSFSKSDLSVFRALPLLLCFPLRAIFLNLCFSYALNPFGWQTALAS